MLVVESGALTGALRPYGGTCRYQDRRHHLDHATTVLLKPDLVYERPDADGQDAPFGVVDAKYKLGSADGGDLYQMLAYCTALGLRQGHLISAGEAPARHVHQIQRSGIAIIHHVLDLSEPPHELLDQVKALAAEIAQS